MVMAIGQKKFKVNEPELYKTGFVKRSEPDVSGRAHPPFGDGVNVQPPSPPIPPYRPEPDVPGGAHA